MKVSELIEQLQELDPDLVVITTGRTEYGGYAYNEFAQSANEVNFDMVPDVYICSDGGSTGVIIE